LSNISTDRSADLVLSLPPDRCELDMEMTKKKSSSEDVLIEWIEDFEIKRSWKVRFDDSIRSPES